MPTANDIVEHFLSRSTWVDRSNTVDRVIIGDGQRNFEKCFVAWMPTMNVLRKMVDEKVQFLIGHEPTFWNHFDTVDENDSFVLAKRNFINDNGLTVIRIHDCWDRWPEIGIPWAWAKFLGISTSPVAIAENNFMHRYDISPMPFGEFTSRVAARCQKLGEPVIQVTGSSDAVVSKIGIGTGCYCSPRKFLPMGCDCSVVCDDGTRQWADIQMASEIGHPVIRVNHGTSEEPGMLTLTDYINSSIQGLVADYVPTGCVYSLTSSTGEK